LLAVVVATLIFGFFSAAGPVATVVIVGFLMAWLLLFGLVRWLRARSSP
jgi:hypothetical protein